MLLLRISDDPKPSLCLVVAQYHSSLIFMPTTVGNPLGDLMQEKPTTKCYIDSSAATRGDIAGLPPADPDPSSASECQRIQDWLASCESHQGYTTTLPPTRETRKDCSPLPTRCARVSLSEASSSASSPVHVALEET